tara:strand:- start:206 stop:469 length:264 start_codon:yes stop_codon:yes gene_type:complete
MSFLDVLIFFLVVWWPIFFILLPIGYEPITKYDNQTEYVRSAPDKPRILYKFILASILAFLLTLLIWTLDFYEFFSLKSFFLKNESK